MLKTEYQNALKLEKHNESKCCEENAHNHHQKKNKGSLELQKLREQCGFSGVQPGQGRKDIRKDKVWAIKSTEFNI